jgi:hypothetical protein
VKEGCYVETTQVSGHAHARTRRLLCVKQPPTVATLAGSIAPPPAASTAAAAATPAAAAATEVKPNAASATSTASAASVPVSVSPIGKLYGGLGGSDIFLVEDIERRQADVGDFLFTESYFVARFSVLWRHCRRRRCR